MSSRPNNQDVATAADGAALFPLADPLDLARVTAAPAVGTQPDNDEDAPDRVSSSERYALRFAGVAGEYLLARQSAALRRLLDAASTPAMHVLDVGGGHLQTAPVIVDRGHRVVVHGSDTSCLFRVPALAARHPALIEARIGPLWELPATNGEFDLVIAIRMLGHVTRWRVLLAELCRASSRYLILEFAAASGVQRLSGAFFGLKRRVEGDTRYFETYDLRDVEAELRRLGFRVRVVERQFVLPIALHRMLRRPALSTALETLCARLGLTRRVGSPVLLLAERR